jgi:tRNA(Ile)-lysidine synthase
VTQFDLRSFVVQKDADQEAVDFDKVEGAVSVRSWQAGDRFHPLGAPGTKKLQDFFTDAKVPESERYFIPIVEDARGILWVVGLRLDERARITARTKQVLKMRFRRT